MVVVGGGGGIIKRLLPYDPAPEEAEEHIEGQRAPDDKMIDPGPVPRVQRQLWEEVVNTQL